MKVEDHGKGIPQEKLAELQSKGNSGVGIRAMRERVEQFGGSFDINSDARGTVVIARVPAAKAARRRSAA